MSGAFLLYGVIGILGTIYLYFRLPETEGVPLEVIEGFFTDGKNHMDRKSQRGRRLTRNKSTENCRVDDGYGDLRL